MTPRVGRRPSRPLRQWWNDLGWRTRRRLKVTAVGLAAAVLLAGGGWGLTTFVFPDPDLACDGGEAEGIARVAEGGECVGVTDGSFVFADYLADVSARVREENERVVAEAARADEPVPYVSIAFLLPFTSTDPIEQGHMLRELQGAYLAQYRANQAAERPNIRLVVGNTGADSAHWAPVVDRLAEMAASPEDRLRAVTGFNVSRTNTEDAIAAITNDANLPVVAGPLTADDLQNGPDGRFPGLAKVIANNSDQAEALASFYDHVPPERTLLVEDVGPDDNYIRSLREVYRERTRDSAHAPETFRSQENVNDEGNLPNEFRDMVNTICNMADVDTIYFAGRNVQLRIFVNALVDRGCQEKRYTVITISGASTLVSDEELDWEGLADGDVTVRYTSNAHPDAWLSGDAPNTGGSAADFEELLRVREEAGLATGEGAVDLTDSRAITMYDAVSTAVAGVRNAVTEDNAVPDLDDVENSWSRMHGDRGNFVHGASGWICLDAYGRPYNKAVSIVQLDPATRGISFEGLAWPTGGPPDANCQIPNTDE